MAKFKVGDKVKIAPNASLEGSSYYYDDKLEVETVWNAQEVSARKSGDFGGAELWREDELELYVEDKKPEEVVVVDTANKEVKVGFVPKSEFDEVNKAAHYNQGKYEVIDVLRDWLGHEQFIGFLRGNVLKYVARYQQKGGIKDLQKAEYYNKKLIEEVGKQWK